jgi:Cu+-exporting ATPase
MDDCCTTPSARVPAAKTPAPVCGDCGCTAVPSPQGEDSPASRDALAGLSSRLLTAFGVVLGIVVLLVVLGEWFGLLDRVSAFIPWPAWLAAVLAGG